MCTPLAVAGAAVSAGGMAMSNRAQNKAASQRQSAIDRQNDLAATEFDTRMSTVREGDKRTNQLTVEGYAEKGALEDDTFAKLQSAETDRITRDTGATDSYYAGLGDILSTQLSGMDAARTEYDALVEAERGVQAGYRDQADARVDALIPTMGTVALNDGRVREATSRGGITDYATRNAPAIDSNFTGTSVGDRLLDFNIDQVNQESAADAGRQAQILAYSDAAENQNRGVANAQEDLSFIDLNARQSMSKLPYALDPSKISFQNTVDRAGEARGKAQADLQGKLNLSAAELQTSTVPLKRYASSIDKALSDYYSSRLTQESDFAQNIIGASQRYEDVNRGLTNYRVSNISGESPMGNFLTGVGGSMLTGGINGGGPSWGDLGDLAADPFGVTPPAGTYGPVQPQTWLGRAVYG